ncbi:unnamed protein product [Gemmata massiliana]|uniref:Uncharacterized protein n=1 Tax=Gemmata massiliana TaxID=1210884 RepID=A0A6P2DKC1_9BACT|nr:hypothetical protein [Gemmata massiliana]VTS01992.1 unnamed protein product [Gemmata massiliana]
MSTQLTAEVEVPQALLEAIASLPTAREVAHCGTTFTASPFDIYATCPACRTRLKLRSFGAVAEIQDVFDAVFAWMNQPGAAEVAQKRREEIAEDTD